MKRFDYLKISLVLLGCVVGPVLGSDQSTTTQPFTFVQVCDPQLGWGFGYQNDVNSLKLAVSHINGLKPDLVVFCGDLVNNFNDSSVADFNEIRSGLTMPSYCAPGNHDVGNSPTVASLNRYRQAIGMDYFSFEHKGYTFVITDTSLWKAPLAGESEKQDTWLKQTLEAARDKNSPVFVVQHYPLYLKSPDEAEEYYNLPPAKRSELLALFENCGVVAVLGGHRHELIINEYKGIQLVNGEATSRNTDGRPLGFRLWHVDSPTSIRHEFRPLVPEMPSADFNGDEVIDCADMCIMVDHWGEDYALCDIAPPPFGDGIVDVQDLIALAEHLFEDYRLMAHWNLDETDGTIAHDGVGNNDGILTGGPLWQPANGQVAGALQFDGLNDYVSTPFILDPAAAPFSIFAWIKGGAPGQVVISQTGIPWGANWLGAGPSDGSLMTELKGTGRWDRPLVSGSIITDGSWHHIGLVWDGSNRTLYVDDVAVSTDTQNDLGSSNGGLYVGAGKTLNSGSFFSGLIDDIRIYNRAIIP
jgi:predicted phosphodiesterase